MPNYEVMLLVEPTAASKEWTKVQEEFSATCEKHGAKVLLFNKWGERKLSYPIKKVTRGTFALGYFETIEKDVPKKIKAEFMLSERVMRTLITRHEGEVKELIMPPEETRRFRRGDRDTGYRGGGGGYRPGGGGGGYRPRDDYRSEPPGKPAMKPVAPPPPAAPSEGS